MTILETLQTAGLPVISAEENGSIVMGSMTPEQEDIYTDLLVSYYKPATYADITLDRDNRQKMMQEVQNMISRLDQIQAATNPTTPQIIQAIKDEALYIERIIRVLVKLL